MKKRIVFFAGSIEPSIIEDITRGFSVNIILPNPDLLIKWKGLNYNVIDMHQFFNTGLYHEIELENFYNSQYSHIQKTLFSDSRTFFLMERIFKFKRENSVFNISGDLVIFILSTLKYLQNVKPELILAPSTPHHLSWFFCYCAEMLGIKIVYTQTSPITYKKWMVEGISHPKFIPLKGEPAHRKMQEWIKKLESNYENAIPEYEKLRNITFSQGDGNLLANLKDIVFKSPNNSVRYNKILNFRNKLKSLKHYESMAFMEDSLPEKFIVFFMHFQPERTSLPEGREYAQQMSIIMDLHLNLPKDYVLIVKEHPSMFRNVFNKRVRTNRFYKNINGLKNVKMASLKYNSFDLIDNAKGVITITGTVGIEALIRNKPVLIYGDAQYKDFRFVFNQKVVDEKRSFVDILAGQSAHEDIKQTTIQNLNEVDKISFFKTETNFSSNAFKQFLSERM